METFSSVLTHETDPADGYQLLTRTVEERGFSKNDMNDYKLERKHLRSIKAASLNRGARKLFLGGPEGCSEIVPGLKIEVAVFFGALKERSRLSRSLVPMSFPPN